jgi:hypothetical protein
MNRRSFLFLFVALGWQTGILSQNNPLLKYIPEDATTAVHFDIKRMGGKIPGETFRNSTIYRQMMKDPGMPWSSLLTEPEKLGIDLSAGLILAMKYPGTTRYRSNKPIIQVFLKLKDAETFTNNINKLIQDKEQGEKNEELYKVYGTDRILSPRGEMTAGWNNDVFVMTSGYDAEMDAEIERYLNASVADTAVLLSDTLALPTYDAKSGIGEIMERFKRSQRDLCFQLLTPKTSSSLMSNVHFTSAMNSEADIKFWSTGSSNPVTEKMLPFASLLNKTETFSGKNTIMLVNFENGRIVAKASNFPGEMVGDVYKKYPVPSQNIELAKRLPAGVLLGLANISFNQQMAGELFEKSGLLQLLDSLKSEIPFDLSLLPGVFKPNLMIAVVKSDITTTTDEAISKMNGLQLIIALSIADKAKFEKLKPAVKEAWDSNNKKETEEDDVLRPKRPKGLYAKHNNELLVLSLSPQTAEAFLNNTGTGTVPAVLQEYSKYPMVVSIDLKQILGITSNDQPERKRNKGMNEIMGQVFDQVLVYGGGYENGSVNSVFEFRFSDQNENSLKQLFGIATSIAEKEESRIKEGTEEWENRATMDTAVIVDTAMIYPGRVPTPRFKDPEVQLFADEWAAYLDELLTTYSGGLKEAKKMEMLAKKADALLAKSQKYYGKFLNDPEETKKFSAWLKACSNQISVVLQEVTLGDIYQEEEKVPPPPPAKPGTPLIEIPTFRNAEVNAFAKEYTSFMVEYIKTYKRNDQEKIVVLNKKREALTKRSGSIRSKLDPKESKKFTDWMAQLNDIVAVAIIGSDTAPPPPKVEMKKFTPPVIRKDN